jgi:hypothetical protein
MFFYIFPTVISSFANIDRPVTFLLYDLECYFLNDVHIFLELKASFGKYHPVYPKKPKKFFTGTLCKYKTISNMTLIVLL